MKQISKKNKTKIYEQGDFDAGNAPARYYDTYQGMSGRYAMSSNQIWQGFIAPWLNVLKIAKLEAQKTLARALTFLRVITTFNREKLQNIMANHKDRMKSLDDKTKTLLDAYPVSSDVAALAFILNPGAYIASKIDVAGTAKATAEWFREAGFGDFTPGEISNPDRNTIALARKREQSGLIRKALRGLNSLFMAGYDPQGFVLVEQDEPEEKEKVLPFEERDYSKTSLSEEGFNSIISAGGGLSGIKEAQAQMLEDANSFLSASDSASKLIEILSSISEVTDLEQYIEFLEKIQQISPEVGVPSKSEVESALDSDVKKLKSQKGAEEETAKIILSKKGIEKPSEEEISSVTKEEKDQEVMSVAFGNILSRLKMSAVESAKEIYENHTQLYNELYPEAGDQESKVILDKSEYGSILNSAKENLEKANRLIQNIDI
jgi:hypothetical protein